MNDPNIDAGLTPDKTIPCRICGESTNYLGTRLCNPCWEINRHVDLSPRSRFMKVVRANQHHDAREALIQGHALLTIVACNEIARAFAAGRFVVQTLYHMGTRQQAQAVLTVMEEMEKVERQYGWLKPAVPQGLGQTIVEALRP